jgi:uncharacterized membrane protein YfcA
VPGFSLEVLALAGLVAVVAGVVRGITGFGGAMVMAPPLALLLGPRVAVPVTMLLEGIAAAPMLWQTRDLVRWRTIGRSSRRRASRFRSAATCSSWPSRSRCAA